MPRAELRTWRTRLLHGSWRLVDLELFHVLLALVNVLTALLAAVLVVALTHRDGNVRVSVGFVAVLVAGLVVIRGAARSGLHAAERRCALLGTSEARSAMLEAIGLGARVAPGAASAFVTRSAAAIGDYLAQAAPARAVAGPITVGSLVVLALVDPWSALIAGAVVVSVPFVLSWFGRRAALEATTSLARLRSLGTRALELLEGAVELRALGAVGRGRDELGAATDRAVASTRGSLRTALRAASSLDVLAGLAVGLVAMTDGLRLLHGDATLGHSLAAVLLTVEVFAPLRAAGQAFHVGADGTAALAVLDDAVRSVERPASVPGASRGATPRATPAAIRAERLAVAPAPGAAPVVRDLDLDVPAGGSLLLLGPTGSGKTTVLEAIAGRPLVAGGILLVGNASPAALSSRQLAATFGVVSQRPLVVAGSLRENLELGGPRRDDAVLGDVARRCGLARLLDRDEGGLDAQLGEEGRRLSAGERTRVALARIVLREPGVVLLDEVGAHLDEAELDALRLALAGFLASRTVIEAAHGRPLLDDAPSAVLGARPVAP